MEGSGDSKGRHRSQVEQKESVDSHEGGNSSQVNNGDVSGSESRGYDEEYYSSESLSAESQV